MADTLARLSGPAALTTSAATQYTSPALTTTTILTVHVCNETAAAKTFTLSIGTDGAGKRIFHDFNVPADGVVSYSVNLVLAAAEVVQALASANTALTLTLSGVKTT